MSVHYTATVEVTKVIHTEGTVYRNEPKPASRETQEVARVVLRSTSLEALATKNKATLDAGVISE